MAWHVQHSMNGHSSAFRLGPGRLPAPLEAAGSSPPVTGKLTQKAPSLSHLAPGHPDPECIGCLRVGNRKLRAAARLSMTNKAGQIHIMGRPSRGLPQRSCQGWTSGRRLAWHPRPPRERTSFRRWLERVSLAPRRWGFCHTLDLGLGLGLRGLRAFGASGSGAHGFQA